MPPNAHIYITPTNRLARNLARELALYETANGKTAWLPSSVYTFTAWLNQLHHDYLLKAEDDRVLINAQQSLVLWQSLIDREVFIGEPQVAGLAQRAWRTIHEYELAAPEQWQELLLSEDSRRFKHWAAAYRAACANQGLVDEWAFTSEVPSLLDAKKIEAPEAIELVGFELPMTPLQAKILAALEAAGTQLTRRETGTGATVLPEIIQFAEADDELAGAAIWARNLLEDEPDRSIAIVVPDLSGRVDRVDRLFRQVFDPPGFALQPSDSEPWHISLGKPLAAWSLVSDALAMLSLGDHRLTQPEATQLLRSPYLAGWQDEAVARNQTLARLTRRAPYDLTLNELQWALGDSGAGALAEQLSTWQGIRREATGPAWPSAWAGRFQEELTSLGFASGRSLNSAEYQVLHRWHDLLETFSALDVVTATPIARREALDVLTERASSAIFRERNPGVPVEVLGVEEALGSEFDALWITTLDSDTWPGPTRRDPLIPSVVQSTIPRATSEGCIERAQLELAGLLTAAPTTRGSFAKGSDETALEVTALLDDCSLQEADPRPTPPPANMAPPLLDDQAPVLEGTSTGGGTGVLRNQSSCPFRAFAERRLKATDLTPPRPGLDAGQRGTVIHKALELFWADLHGSADLAALNPKAQEQRISSAVEAALDDFTSRFRLTLTAAARLLEQRRTERALARWLDVERQRSDFSVIEHEHDITLDLPGLSLSGKIDRLDRLADGTTMLIDYKTGRTGKGDWFPEPRIADPQLPAYAISMNPKPSAIAFARIRPDELKFEGLAADDTGTPGVGVLANERGKFEEFVSWGDLLHDWQTHLEALARDFADGKAVVEPREPSACNYCHLHALCRIQERAPYDSMAAEDDDE